jgi:hemerythrin-like domain-containing protein
MSDPEAFKIRHELSILSSKLTIHLAMEDKALYPYLLKSQNLTVEKTAKQFMDEMGNLVTTFKEYNHKWFHTNLIRAQFEEFRTETDLILQALKLRIKREENELYPLVEENL